MAAASIAVWGAGGFAHVVFPGAGKKRNVRFVMCRWKSRRKESGNQARPSACHISTDREETVAGTNCTNQYEFPRSSTKPAQQSAREKDDAPTSSSGPSFPGGPEHFPGFRRDYASAQCSVRVRGSFPPKRRSSKANALRCVSGEGQISQLFHGYS